MNDLLFKHIEHIQFKYYYYLDSLLSSVTSAAKASGFAPSSSNWEQMFRVSRSKPVPNKFDISNTTKIIN